MNMKNKTDESLEYIANDCMEAISANPENPKCEEYLATVRACRAEQAYRERIRILQGMADRRRKGNSGYDKYTNSQADTADFMLARITK